MEGEGIEWRLKDKVEETLGCEPTTGLLTLSGYTPKLDLKPHSRSRQELVGLPEFDLS